MTDRIEAAAAAMTRMTKDHRDEYGIPMLSATRTLANIPDLSPDERNAAFRIFLGRMSQENAPKTPVPQAEVESSRPTPQPAPTPTEVANAPVLTHEQHEANLTRILDERNSEQTLKYAAEMELPRLHAQLADALADLHRGHKKLTQSDLIKEHIASEQRQRALAAEGKITPPSHTPTDSVMDTMGSGGRGSADRNWGQGFRRGARTQRIPSER